MLRIFMKGQTVSLKFVIISLAFLLAAFPASCFAGDSVAPTGSIAIGAALSPFTPAIVTLNLSAQDNISPSSMISMRISNTNRSDWGTLYEEPFASSKTWVLAAGANGTRNVYVRYKDAAGNWSKVYSTSTNLEIPDSTLSKQVMLINNGDHYSDSANVSLSFNPKLLGYTSSPPNWVLLSNDGINWRTERYSNNIAWTLSAVDGPKFVFGQFANVQGGYTIYSDMFSASIELAAGDAPTTEVWIAQGLSPNMTGRGSQSDPYLISAQDKNSFDNIMRAYAGKPFTPPGKVPGSYVTVHIGPGTFLTRGSNIQNDITQNNLWATSGFKDSANVFSDFWTLKDGWKIIGAGAEKTKLKLIEMKNSGDYAYYSLISGPSHDKVQYVTISGLTLDASFNDNICPAKDGLTNYCTTTGIFITGNHLRVRNVKVINSGTGNPRREAFSISLMSPATSAPNLPYAYKGHDILIEDSMISEPGIQNRFTVSYICGGGGGERDNDPKSFYFAEDLVLRNNTFVGPTDPNAKAIGFQVGGLGSGIRNLSEGNRIIGLDSGFYMDTWSHYDYTYRNNLFENVKYALFIYLQTEIYHIESGVIFENNYAALNPNLDWTQGVLVAGKSAQIKDDRYTLKELTLRRNAFGFFGSIPANKTPKGRMASMRSVRHSLIENNLTLLDYKNQITWENMYEVGDTQANLLAPSKPKPLELHNNRRADNSLVEEYPPVFDKIASVNTADPVSFYLPTTTSQWRAVSTPAGATFNNGFFAWESEKSGKYMATFDNSLGQGEKYKALIKVNTPYSDQYFSSGLKAYWHFDQDANRTNLQKKALSEYSMTPAVNLLGATKVTLNGYRENALSFSALSDNAQVQNDQGQVLPLSSSPFSISFWIKAKELPASGTSQHIFQNSNYLKSGFRVGLSNTGISTRARFWSSEDGGDISVYSAQSLNAGVWYHVVATYDGFAAEIYVNGDKGAEFYLNSFGSLNGSFIYGDYIGKKPFGLILPNSQILKIGGDYAGHSFFSGEIDEIAIWDRYLSGAEVAQLFRDQTDSSWNPLIPAKPEQPSVNLIQ